MRGPLLVSAVVAVAGAAFVIVSEPSSAESREHDWLAVVFMATTSGVFFAAGTAPRHRAKLLGAAYALFVATAFAWLVESLALWAALAVATALAVEGARRARRSEAPR
jgi:hypothetical protein